jgi:hypothetical protein
MIDPTRRQVILMAEEAGISDHAAAVRLVRLTLAAFRPAPITAKDLIVATSAALAIARGDLEQMRDDHIGDGDPDRLISQACYVDRLETVKALLGQSYPVDGD